MGMDKKIRQEYKIRLREETSRAFWNHYEGKKKFTEPLLQALISAIATIVIFYYVDRVIDTSELLIVIIVTIGVPCFWAIYIFLRNMANAPLEVYKKQREKLSRYDWTDLNLDVSPHELTEGKGYSITVFNNKKFDILISLEINGVKIGNKEYPETIERYYLGHIVKNKKQTRETIECFESKGVTIKTGETIRYVVTKELSSVSKYEIVTFLKKNKKWKFSSVRENTSPKLMMVIDIVICGGVFLGKTISRLNERMLNYYVYSDGSLKKVGDTEII